MSNTAGNAVIMVITTILAKVLGLGRELSLAFAYGANHVSDAYVVSFTLPTILFSGLGTAMLTSYISVYTDLSTKRPGREKNFHNRAITLSVLMSMAFLLVFLLFKYPIVQLFALGFKGEQLDFTVHLSSLMIFSLLFLGIGFMVQGYLQMKGKFFTVGMVSVPLNIAVIISLLVAKENYDILAYGVVLGYLGELILVLVVALRNGWRYRPDFHFNTDNIRRFLLMVLPIFLGKTINQINILIDKTIASLLSEGVVSVMNYGNRITGFVTSVFVVSVTTALFPQMSRLSAEKNVKRLKKTYITSSGVIGLFVIPISAGMMMFADEFVSILFERGAFTADDVHRTGQVVTFYALGLLFYSLKEVTINVYYALQDTRTVTVNSILTILLNVVFNLILMRPLEHSGLALATALSSMATTLILIVKLRNRMGRFGYRNLFFSYGKMILAAGIMAAGTLPLYHQLIFSTESMALPLAISIIVAVILYAAACILLRIRQFGEVVIAVANKISRKK